MDGSAPPRLDGRGRTNTAVGLAWALTALLIWSSWFAVTRLGVTRTLDVPDIVAFRMLGGALVLLPLTWRQARQIPPRAWGQGVWLALLWGAPFVLLVGYGIKLTSAAHAAALTPSLMPVFAGLIAWATLSERVHRVRLLGFGAIVAGVITMVLSLRGVAGPEARWGDAALLLAAVMWAAYTVRLRGSGLSALQAATLVAVYSCLVYLPVYALAGLHRLERAGGWELAAQALYQGLLVGGVSVPAFNLAIARLGPGAAAAIVSLVPVVATLLAVPILGEWPSSAEAVAVTVIAGGVLLAASAPRRA